MRKWSDAYGYTIYLQVFYGVKACNFQENTGAIQLKEGANVEGVITLDIGKILKQINSDKNALFVTVTILTRNNVRYRLDFRLNMGLLMSLGAFDDSMFATHLVSLSTFLLMNIDTLKANCKGTLVCSTNWERLLKGTFINDCKKYFKTYLQFSFFALKYHFKT